MRSHSRKTEPVPEMPRADSPLSRQMQMQFAQTGTYRAIDVRRVLGDPRQAVEIKTVSDLELASRATRG